MPFLKQHKPIFWQTSPFSEGARENFNFRSNIGFSTQAADVWDI
jgi:hypothetical protein